MTGQYDCDKVGDLIPEFLAGRVSEADDREVRRHLESCAECRNRANAVSLLQQTPIPRPDPDRWDHFVTEVVEETEHHPRWAPVPGFLWYLLGALIVIAIAIQLFRLLIG
jgi:predicted anti-sigma-YlaC factor YlaD